jgi:hypothetical protein
VMVMVMVMVNLTSEVHDMVTGRCPCTCCFIGLVLQSNGSGVL